MARAASYDHQILRPRRSVDEEAFMVARVPRRRSESDKSETARGNFPEASAARAGAWQGFG